MSELFHPPPNPAPKPTAPPPKPPDALRSAVAPEQRESLSSVKIALNAKGMAQPEVKAYEGVTEEEMKRLGTLALETFNDVKARLGALANFS